MRISYSIQGMFFAFGLVGLIFILNMICPDSAGTWCFADHFMAPVFLPSILVSKFSNIAPALMSWEPLIIIVYWGIVGFLLGLCFDIYSENNQEEDLS